jgi:hypothetical protein
MCINYKFNNNVKSEITKKIDNFNNNFLDFIENFDNKCTELGNFFIRKYKYYFEPKRYSRTHYNNVPTTPLSPDEYETVDIPIPNECQSQTKIIKQEPSKIPSKNQNIEMVNKHIVDNKDSFLDDNVWEILNGV